MADNGTIEQLAGLIQQFEGFGTAAAPSITSGNNPGAIMAGPYAISQGATGIAPNGTAIFPSYQSGYEALTNLLEHKTAAGYNTPQSLISSYEGDPYAVQPSTQNYINYISRGLGIGATDPIPGGAAAAPASGTASGAAALPPGVQAGVSAYDKAAAAGSSAWSWLSDPARAVSVLLGIGLVLGGVFFLRPVQSVVTQTVSRAKSASKLFV
jgi:hypothetical protein